MTGLMPAGSGTTCAGTGRPPSFVTVDPTKSARAAGPSSNMIANATNAAEYFIKW
jgi:hypothetical protein